MLKDPSKVYDQLRSMLARERVLTSSIARYAFANDAGPYLLIPEAVLHPQTESEIQSIFRLAKETQTPVVFRAGGTNLSGQSITDGWLVDIGRYWRKVEPIDQGRKVQVQPGAIGGLVNARLKAFGKKIGPDPSSIMSAMMGGILSNNSSGMCCGVQLNAYHTLDSIRFILTDGSIWDTSQVGEEDRFSRELPSVAQGLIEIRDSVRGSSCACKSYSTEISAKKYGRIQSECIPGLRFPTRDPCPSLDRCRRHVGIHLASDTANRT